MSDSDGMTRRHHAMLFPTGPPLAEIEAVRRAWDPMMAAAIPAHITLVYPDEHPGPEPLSERVKSLAERQRGFRVGVGEFQAFPPPDEGCVYVEIRDDEGEFAALRKGAAAPPFRPIEFPPHLTLIHPRTSSGATEFWRAGVAQLVGSQLMIDAIFITSFEAGKYDVVARHPLLEA